jgi:probable addiction module antidote protein
MSALTARYEDGLHQALLDPAEAAAYLDAALVEDDMDGFLLALRDVAQAREMSQAAHSAQFSLENLYLMLEAHGSSQLSTLDALLRSLGMRLAVEVSTPSILTQPGAVSPASAAARIQASLD